MAATRHLIAAQDLACQSGKAQGQFAQTLTRCREYCVGNGGRDQGGYRLANATGLIAIGENMHIDFRNLIHARCSIVMEVALLNPSVLDRQLIVENG